MVAAQTIERIQLTADLVEAFQHHHPVTITEFTAAELANKLREVANLMVASKDQLDGDPELEDVARQLEAQCMTLLPYGFRWHVLDTVIGDLPEIEERFSHPRTTGRYRTNIGTFVYAAYDEADQLLYVGCTDEIWARMAAHKRGSPWWDHMARIDWEEWPDRATALKKETTLIRRHRPPYNTVGNPDARKPR